MTGNKNAAGAPRIFYGWVMVGVLLLLLSVGMGTSMYMYSVVAGALGQEFAAGRFALMLGSTGMLLMIGLCSPLLGTLLDRYPSKWILVTGAVVMGLGFILMSLSTQLWMVVASYILFISVGAATLSTLVTATLLTRWFVRYRGLAIGIATLGTNLGGSLYPPLFAAVMEAYSWRIALGGLGILVMTIIPVLILTLVADRPEDKDQRPYGAVTEPPLATATGKPDAQAVPKLSFTSLLRHRNFLLVVLIAGAASATNTTLLTNLSLFAMDLGEPAVRGAFLVSLVALLGVFFSPLIGWLCDVIDIRLVAALVTLSMASACLIFSTATTYPLLVTAALLQGIGGGGVFPLWASLVGHLYHTRVYGQVMGATTLAISIPTAAAPPLAGWVHDTTGNYRLLFLALLVILSVLTLLTALIRVPRATSEKYGAAGGTNMAVS